MHKAPGLDGLNARVLKECSTQISHILALIYNESLAQGNVKDDWRQANTSLGPELQYLLKVKQDLS